MKAIAAFLTVALLFSCLFLACSRESSSNYWPTSEWRVIAPEKAGIDATVLEGLSSVQSILPDVSSILVVRKGYIALEKYYEGDAKTLRSTFDITKSVVSCLIGVAIKQGLINSIDKKMIDSFPENQIIRSDPLTQRITLRHLLTMSDGIRDSGNLLELYFNDPKMFKKLRADPGSIFQYNNMSAQIVSMILTNATGKSAFDYAKQHLFSPLGITECSWAKSRGISNGAYGILLTTRDLAKFGYLYLNKGTWEKQELIPEKWVADSTVEQITTEDSSNYFKQYGFYWWVHTFGAHPGYFACGWGGQILCIVPDLSIVAVVTSRETTLEGAEPKYLEVIEKNILNSIIE